jgi:hypothetical protein
VTVSLHCWILIPKSEEGCVVPPGYQGRGLVKSKARTTSSRVCTTQKMLSKAQRELKAPKTTRENPENARNIPHPSAPGNRQKCSYNTKKSQGCRATVPPPLGPLGNASLSYKNSMFQAGTDATTLQKKPAFSRREQHNSGRVEAERAPPPPHQPRRRSARNGQKEP